MCEHDRKAIYKCIFELRLDLDCIGNDEYNYPNFVIWLEDMTDKELIDTLFELLEPYTE